jgi:DNA-binding response OmpR family regulator
MEQIKILTADQDPKVRSEIKTYTAFEGMTADEAADGISVIKLFRRNEYGVIILDADIPELDAWSVCSQVRKGSDVPLIITSSRSDEEEMLSFYDVGADDVIIKPFSGKLLMARINIIIRRGGRTETMPRRLIFEGLCIDTVSRTVYVDGETITITPKEYKLLMFLVQNRNKVLTRETILQSVWGEDFFGTDRTVDTHVKMLREHIKPYDKLIDTVWGTGYMFR